jgi:long-chain acyl-CoA synthetase
VVCGDQEQVDKVLEVKDELPLLKKIIVMDMKGLRRYKDPMIMPFEDVEKPSAMKLKQKIRMFSIVWLIKLQAG